MSVLPKVVPVSARQSGDFFRQLEEKFRVGGPELQAFMESGKLRTVASLILGKSIIAEVIDDNTLRLGPIVVDYDKTPEQILSGFVLEPEVECWDFVGDINAGKKGAEEVEAYLVRIVTENENGPYPKQEEVPRELGGRGFKPAEIGVPLLFALRQHKSELGAFGVHAIAALDKSSQLKSGRSPWFYPTGCRSEIDLSAYGESVEVDEIDWVLSQLKS